MAFNESSIHHELIEPTKFIGFKLWVVIIICVVIALILVLISTFLFICWKRRKDYKQSSSSSSKPAISKNVYNSCSMDRRLLSRNGWDIEMSIKTPEKQVMYSDQLFSNGKIDHMVNMDHVVVVDPDPGPDNMYTLTEIAAATKGLDDENVIGSGNHGVVFCGIFSGNSHVAIKKLFGYRNSVMSFVEEAEKMCLIRHKNMVKLLGYCAEGRYRMLVYEHISNGNLKQWLHQYVNDVSPLTWDIRMKIIIGIAKCLAYLHEGIEPPVVHQNLKSCNVMLDQEWNPKISDLGINKLLGLEWNRAEAHPTGMSGYIAPEYGDARVLDEKSDVYSFGVLIMEIISGKTSTESTVNEIEEYLVDWIKSMVADQRYDLLLDPKLPEPPSTKELKRMFLIALRCVDFEVENRPKMSEIMHMLEPRDLLLSDELVIKRQVSRRNSLGKML